MTDFPDRQTNFPFKHTEQSFYEDSTGWSGSIAGWIALGAAILLIFGIIYNLSGVSMDHPQINPSAIQQPAKPIPPTTSPKMPAPTPQ
jgi:hypothetical protein